MIFKKIDSIKDAGVVCHYFFSALKEYHSYPLAVEPFYRSCLEMRAHLYVEELIERLMQLLQSILSNTRAYRTRVAVAT